MPLNVEKAGLGRRERNNAKRAQCAKSAGLLILKCRHEKTAYSEC